MPKYYCIESTLDFYIDTKNKLERFLIRIWKNERTLNDEYFNLYICDHVFVFCRDLELSGVNVTSKSIIEFIADFPNINAIQVKDLNSPYDSGIMVYLVPFDN